MTDKEIRKAQRRCVAKAVKEMLKERRKELARTIWCLRANKNTLEF